MGKYPRASARIWVTRSSILHEDPSTKRSAVELKVIPAKDGAASHLFPGWNPGQCTSISMSLQASVRLRHLPIFCMLEIIYSSNT